MTDPQRDAAQALLGDLAKDLNDEQLLSASLQAAQEVIELNLELSTTNAQLQEEITTLSTTKAELETKVTTLSATPAVEPVVELSATEKALIGENLTLKIDGIADKQQWPDAYRAEVKAKLAGGQMIALSAGGTAEAPAVPTLVLDLLAKRPAKGLRADGTQITPTQTVGTLLSRNDEDADEVAKTVNPLLETAKRLAAK
ncbi:MAG TPA: hypothetical protein VF595_04180 [Tepidisphaeraceae bacterium]|jgi:hypothetical protein